MEELIPSRLATLGHPQRLALFRLLMRRYPDRVPATELARALGVKPNTLSTYVNALMRAGLVTQERVGTSLRYAIDMGAAQETVGFLMNECCRGRPDICAPAAQTVQMQGRVNVLFLCTGNSARSIFAEAILREAAGDRFAAHSAGTRPASAPNPLALAVLEAHGHDIAVLSSKGMAAVQAPGAPRFDFVFTVCDRAANEDCPAWGGAISGHWGIPDPVQAEGGAAERRLAFEAAYEALRRRILAFAALPLAELDRVALQHAVDDIGRQDAGVLA